jgi:hypothetical protein
MKMKSKAITAIENYKEFFINGIYSVTPPGDIGENRWFDVCKRGKNGYYGNPVRVCCPKDRTAEAVLAELMSAIESGYCDL